MKAKRTIQKTENNTCCDTCANCLYICEGDYVCEVEMEQDTTTLEPIKEEHTPTEHYFWCGGKHWLKI